jgi:hypothetical protein
VAERLNAPVSKAGGQAFCQISLFDKKPLQVLTLCHLKCGFGSGKLQTPSPKIVPDLVETGIETGMNSASFCCDLFAQCDWSVFAKFFG